MTKKIKRLTRPTGDIRIAAVDMSMVEARLVLRQFLELQPAQMSTKAHYKNLVKAGHTNSVMRFVKNSTEYVRTYQYKELLDIWTEKFPEARWAKSIFGIGSIIAAGLVCHIDFNKVKSPSSITQHAGQAPNSRKVTIEAAYALMEQSMELYGDTPKDTHIKWLCKQLDKDFNTFHKFCRKKGRPYHWDQIFSAIRWPSYDPTLKHICLLLGNTFILKKSLYQAIYRERRDHWEIPRNEAGLYKKVAAKQLKMFNYKPWKDPYKCYTAGYLPDGHINNRARKYAVKIFLSHYYSVYYYIRTGEVPYNAYAIDILSGHKKILVPNLEKANEGRNKL